MYICNLVNKKKVSSKKKIGKWNQPDIFLACLDLFFKENPTPSDQPFFSCIEYPSNLQHLSILKKVRVYFNFSASNTECNVKRHAELY